MSNTEIKKSFTILIVEDDYALGVLVERMLNRAGFATHRLTNGTETIRYCSDLSPHNTFLLLDYNLGDMTAEEIMTELKNRGQDFPFIVMTGYGSETVAVEMMKLGAEDYIIKTDQTVELLVQTLAQAIERLQTAQILSKTQQALETAHQAISAAANGIVIAQMKNDYPIIYYNPAFETMTGYQCSNTPTLTNWLQSYELRDQSGLLEFQDALYHRRATHLQLRRDSQDASHWHQVSLSFIPKDPAQHILIGILSDTTKDHLNAQRIERLREQLDQTQRLAIAGQIAKELAHEVGHPLTLISSKIQFMIAKDSPEKESLSFILQHIDRITNLLRRFSSDSSDILSPTPVAVDSLIQSVLHLCPAREGISVSMENLDDLPEIQIDKAKITQVLLNLLVNAMEACRRGGQIVFSARTAALPDHDKHYIAIAIQDNGCGIAPEYCQKIFEPFYSTKSTSRNRGLGLPICQNIAHQHEGWIEVESTVNQGTRFTLMLPLESAGPRQFAGVEPIQRHTLQGET